MTSHPMLATADRAATAGTDARDDLAPRVIPVSSPQRKFATVMFVDLKGSMTLSRACEAEEWWSLIDGLFELMCDGVGQFDGWVGNFTGDGITAVFDGPRGTDDHARRACDAALWLRDAICAPMAVARTVRGVELSVRVGINSGDVVTGTIGDRYNRYSTAIGYPVALAKRIEALATPGRIYLTEHTGALVADTTHLRDLGAFAIKGADQPVGVFELVGRSAAGNSGRANSRMPLRAT